MPWLIEKLYR